MSTNWYWHRAGYQPVHIAKTSYCVSLHGIPGFIESWSDWVLLFEQTGEIRDEYGSDWSAEEFIARITEFDTAARREQYDWVVNNDFKPRLGIEYQGYWLDDEGFSFYAGEFF